MKAFNTFRIRFPILMLRRKITYCTLYEVLVEYIKLSLI